MVAHGARSLLVKLLDMKMWDGSLIKYYISSLVCPRLENLPKILFHHSLRIFPIQRILLHGGNTMIKWNSNLPPDEASSNPHCFLLLPTTRRQYYHHLHRCHGDLFFHPPTTPRGLALQPELLDSKTYHFWTPHSLINRVKSPIWECKLDVYFIYPLNV